MANFGFSPDQAVHCSNITCQNKTGGITWILKSSTVIKPHASNGGRFVAPDVVMWPTCGTCHKEIPLSEIPKGAEIVGLPVGWKIR